MSQKKDTCRKCGMKLVKNESSLHVANQVSSPARLAHPADHSSTFYTCPMDPDVVRDKPGNCPKCGMKLVPMISGHEGHENHAIMENDFKKRFFLTLPFVFFVTLLSPNIQRWFHFSLSFSGREFVQFLLGTGIVIVGGIPFFKAAKGELKAKNPGMMTLVAFAISVAYIFSVAATFFFPGNSLYWEMATLLSVFLLGHWLEMRAVRGTTGALTELAKLIPPSAHLVKNGMVTDMQTSQLVKRDIVLVKPGEKIPIDGIVIEGESAVNEALITGESRPIGKKKGDSVIGGSINQDGSLTIEVAKIGKDTAIAQIMTLIQQAQRSKPNVQVLADRAAGILFYIAVSAGLIAFIFWLFIFPQGIIFAATVAVAVVVVSCPHALGLAIPTVTTITSMLAAKNGILIKDMKAFEIARKINYVVFDKTGTLTKGAFGVTAIRVSQTTAVKSKHELLKLAAAVEINSQHAIAVGIGNEAVKQKISLPKVKDFMSFPGKGASGVIDGKIVLVGNKSLFTQMQVPLEEEIPSGNTQVLVAIDKKFAGVILLSDIVRTESKEAIKELHAMGIKVAMLTGDTQEVANAVGKELHIDTVFAEVLPEDKVYKVKQLQKEGNIVAMIGDGVNDAPSLTQAHVGIAIGAGTDVAIESAGIILMKNNPLDVEKIITLSKKTHSKMVQNVTWATGYNIFAIPIAGGILYPTLGILLPPEWAALLMSASSVIVVFNALLLKQTQL